MYYENLTIPSHDVQTCRRIILCFVSWQILNHMVQRIVVELGSFNNCKSCKKSDKRSSCSHNLHVAGCLTQKANGARFYTLPCFDLWNTNGKDLFVNTELETDETFETIGQVKYFQAACYFQYKPSSMIIYKERVSFRWQKLMGLFVNKLAERTDIYQDEFEPVHLENKTSYLDSLCKNHHQVFISQRPFCWNK